MQMFRRMAAGLPFSTLLFLCAALPSPAQDLPRGQVVEKVACLHDDTQTYALYLPSNYSRDRRWPVLYALDAGARGRLPVGLFKEAAEKHGYILAGSNNSQNGPVKAVEDAVNALFRDTQARLAVDARRMYVAGFSGGARAAVQVGLAMKGRIAGVLLFGAGFPPDMRPSTITLPAHTVGEAGRTKQSILCGKQSPGDLATEELLKAIPIWSHCGKCRSIGKSSSL
jgi:hypothetical protein